MADKLSESTWTTFLKKQKLELDDKALVKTLAAYDKTDESKPEARLKALEELIKQIPEQVKALLKRKKELGDKPFGLVKDQLYELLAQAEELQKKTRAAASEDEDDEPGNVLLEPKRLLAMLQRCKRDSEQSMNFGFVDAKDKQPAVFAMHPRMSGRKLFAALQAETGVKTGAFGTAWVQVDGEFKGTCLMLQLDKPLSGLVKKVKAPVKAAGFRIAKAVLWSADGTVFEHDDETDEPAAADAGAAATGIPPAPPKPTDKPATPAQPARSPEMEAFMTRLAALVALATAAGDTPDAKQAKLLGSEAGMHSRKGEWDRVEALMKQAEALVAGAKAATPSGATPTSADTDAPMARGTTQAPPMDPAMAFRSRLTGLVPRIKAVEAADAAAAGQINAKRDAAIAMAKQKGFPQEKEAMALLDEIEALIAAAGVGASTGGAPRTAAATGTNVIFQQTRLAWDATRSKLKAEVKKLEDDIQARCNEDEEVGAAGVDVGPLSIVLEKLDSRLMDKLDEALSAPDAAARQLFHTQAKDIVAEYMAFVSSDPLMADIDDSGFAPVAVRATALSALTVLASKL